MQILYHYKPELNLTESLLPKSMDGIFSLKVFIGSWRMGRCPYRITFFLLSYFSYFLIFLTFLFFLFVENVDPSQELLELWIPKGRDLYAIGVQHQNYKPPFGFVMGSQEYWFLLVRKYLGEEYTLVATTSTEKTGLVICVKKELSQCVTNLQVTYLKHNTKSSGGGISDRIAKLKEAREKLKDQLKDNKEKPKEKKDKSKQHIFGGGWLSLYCHFIVLFVDPLVDSNTISLCGHVTVFYQLFQRK
jgi:hypothetical protein